MSFPPLFPPFFCQLRRLPAKLAPPRPGISPLFFFPPFFFFPPRQIHPRDESPTEFLVPFFFPPSPPLLFLSGPKKSKKTGTSPLFFAPLPPEWEGKGDNVPSLSSFPPIVVRTARGSRGWRLDSFFFFPPPSSADRK